MTTDIHTLFSDSGCPSIEELKAYHEHRLPEEERHRIEAHLTDCEMCSDELEGLSLLSDPDRLPVIVEELEQRIAARKVRILRLRPRLILAAAAAMAALLIGSIFVFRFIVLPQQEPLLSEQQAAPVQPADSAFPVVEHETAPAMSSEKKEVRVRAVLPDEQLVDEAIANAPEAPVPISEKTEQEREKVMASESLNVSPSVMEEVAGVGGVSSTRMAKGRDLSAAMEFFSLKRYAEAIPLFEKMIRMDSADYSALYHLTVCYMETGQPAKALKSLENLLRDPDSLYYMQAIRLKFSIIENEQK